MIDNKGEVTSIDPIQYILSDDRPIYYGEMEVVHDDCPFLPIANKLAEKISLHILFEQKTDSFQTVRFYLNQIMGQSNIHDLLSDALNKKV